MLPSAVSHLLPTFGDSREKEELTGLGSSDQTQTCGRKPFKKNIAEVGTKVGAICLSLQYSHRDLFNTISRDEREAQFTLQYS